MSHHGNSEIQQDQAVLTTWILKNITPRKNINLKHTSLSLKAFFEYDKSHGGEYVTNDQFKEAMLLCGFEPVDAKKTYWYFRISDNSPAFKIKW